MPKTKIQKQDIVTELTDKLSKANSVVFADYQGLTMTQLSQIRTQLLEISGELTVTKNNLLKIALKNAKLDLSNEDIFKGSIATLFSYGDEINPIKVLTKALKDNKVGFVKAGLLNGEYLDADKVNKLSELPTKDELRAKVVGTIAAPIYGIVNVLQANIRNLVYTVEAIRKSKGGE